MVNFNVSEKLREHFGGKGQKSHQAAVERATAISAVMNNHSLSIDQQLTTQRAKEVEIGGQYSHNYIVQIARNCTEKSPR